MSPGLPAPVSPKAAPPIQPLTPNDIDRYAERLMARSRQYVLGDPHLSPLCSGAALMMRGLTAKLTEAVGPEEAARLIAEISMGD